MSQYETALGAIRGASPNMAENVTGHLKSPVAGRTDQLMISVPDGAYVLPADIVSSLGEGNTEAGASYLDEAFPPITDAFARGGAPTMTDIAAAGGEYVVPPAHVSQLGGGDMKRGHAILDSFVKQQRAKTVKTLSSLPGPKK